MRLFLFELTCNIFYSFYISLYGIYDWRQGGQMQTLIQTAVLHPIQAVLARLAAVLPSVLWAMVLLLAGALLARLLRKGVEKVLTVGQIDVWSDKAGVNTLLSHLGLGRSPAKVVAVLAWWFLFLIFFVG